MAAKTPAMMPVLTLPRKATLTPITVLPMSVAMTPIATSGRTYPM